MRIRTMLAAAAIASVASSASAGDPARKLYDEGRAAVAEGKFDEACPKLQESYTLSGSAGALLAWADCEESRGKLATALVLWKQGAAKVVSEPDRREFAERRIEALEPRVPRVEVRIGRGDLTGVALAIDGKAVDAGRPVPVDPGTHEVTAAAGTATDRERIEAKVGTSLVVTLFDEAPPPRSPPPAPTASRIDARRADEPPSSRARTAGWIALGVGAAGFVAFGVTGALVLGTCDGTLSPCGGREPVADDLQSEATTLNTINAIGLGVGAVGAVAGTVLLIVGRRAEPHVSASVLPSSRGATVRASLAF